MLLIPLIVAAITDLKTRTIPLWLFPATLFFYIYETQKVSYIENLIALIVVGMMFTLLAVFFSAGGGDIIEMSVVAFVLGLNDTLLLCLYASSILYLWLILKKEKQVPFAPFVLMSYLLLLI